VLGIHAGCLWQQGGILQAGSCRAGCSVGRGEREEGSDAKREKVGGGMKNGIVGGVRGNGREGSRLGGRGKEGSEGSRQRGRGRDGKSGREQEKVNSKGSVSGNSQTKMGTRDDCNRAIGSAEQAGQED
jgi:hypothetical protein